MPHFENLDQYEGKNPRSGKQGIVPIAPHSMQATDYRPHKGDSSSAKRRREKPDFPKVEIEPISVEQMEKEFKAAGRNRRKLNPRRKRKSLWAKFLGFLKSLLPEKKSRKVGRDRDRNRRRGQRTKGGQRGGNNRQQGQRQGQQGQRQAPQGKKQQRNSRPRKRGPQQGQNNPQVNKAKDQGERGSSERTQNPQNDQPGKRRRNRRNRNRSPQGNQNQNRSPEAN